jgi:3-oxoacyl-[acyl-carrier-protein] synthase-3
MSIEAIASAIPSVHQDVGEIARQCGAEIDFIRDKVGVSERYILGPEETGIGLAAKACEALFAKVNLTAEDIGLVVFVTQNPDQRLPQNSAGLAAHLGLPKTCASFDVALGCSGFVYGLAITESFVAMHGIKNAILVTCDPYSRIMAPEDKNTNAVFGDAATATLITGTGTRTTITGLDFGTDGSGGDAIRITAGGAAEPLVSLDQADGVNLQSRVDHSLFMDGRAVFNFVNSTVPGSIKASLDKSGTTMEEIDWFALHQGSSYMLDALTRRARIPAEKVLKNIHRYGNTVSSTIPLLLEELLEERTLDMGGKVLISGFGVGLSWATGIINFKEQTS